MNYNNGEWKKRSLRRPLPSTPTAPLRLQCNVSVSPRHEVPSASNTICHSVTLPASVRCHAPLPTTHLSLLPVTRAKNASKTERVATYLSFHLHTTQRSMTGRGFHSGAGRPPNHLLASSPCELPRSHSRQGSRLSMGILIDGCAKALSNEWLFYYAFAVVFIRHFLLFYNSKK